VLTANAAVNYSQTFPADGSTQKLIYIKNGTLANSEFGYARFASTGATGLNMVDNLTRSQRNSNIYNGAFQFLANIDTSGYARIRVVIHNYSGVTVDCIAWMVTGDAMGSV